MKYLRLTILVAGLVSISGFSAQALSLKEAIRLTVSTHPSVAAARANRRASAYELRQAQGRYLPTVDLTADFGANWIDRPQGFAANRNRKWRNARKVGITINQVLFDGWSRSNDVYRRAARIDAAALRVLQRSEILALEAVEAYIDVRRHNSILAIARKNVSSHKRILGQVRQLVRGGKAPRSDVRQTVERVAAARAIAAQVEQALLEAKAKFRAVIGKDPRRLSRVRVPRRMPRSGPQALKIALDNNPSIRASAADENVARYARDQSQSGYWPTVSLQGNASAGRSIGGTPGRNNDLTGKVVLSWNLFNGGITANREKELTARLGQAKYEYAARARTIGEAVERAYAAYTIGRKRVNFARQQARANVGIVRSYLEEYRLSKRSLLDVLDAERALFNSRFQLSSQSAVLKFSAYQLLGSMGRLLSSVGVSAPAEAKSGFLIKAKKNPFSIDIPSLRQ